MDEKENQQRAFPWRCVMCGKREVNPTKIHWELDMKCGGVIYHVIADDVPVYKCNSCGEVICDNAADDALQRALSAHLATRLAAAEKVVEAVRELRESNEIGSTIWWRRYTELGSALAAYPPKPASERTT